MVKKNASFLEVKREAVRYLRFIEAKGARIRMAYLFGSYARGEQSAGSDVDLLVSLKGFDNGIVAGGYLQKRLFEFKSRLRLDVIGHAKARLDPGVPLEGEVRETGVRLY